MLKQVGRPALRWISNLQSETLIGSTSGPKSTKRWKAISTFQKRGSPTSSEAPNDFTIHAGLSMHISTHKCTQPRTNLHICYNVLAHGSVFISLRTVESDKSWFMITKVPLKWNRGVGPPSVLGRSRVRHFFWVYVHSPSLLKIRKEEYGRSHRIERKMVTPTYLHCSFFQTTQALFLWMTFVY